MKTTIRSAWCPPRRPSPSSHPHGDGRYNLRLPRLTAKGRAGSLARPPRSPSPTHGRIPSNHRGSGARLAGQIASFRSPWERWWTEDDAIWPASSFPVAWAPFPSERVWLTQMAYSRNAKFTWIFVKNLHKRLRRADLKGVSGRLPVARRTAGPSEEEGARTRVRPPRRALGVGRTRDGQSPARIVSLLKRSALKGGPSREGRLPDLAVPERQPRLHAVRCRRVRDVGPIELGLG